MEKYTMATAETLAKMLLLVGYNDSVSFTTHFETDGNGNILEESEKNWFGATIHTQLGGTCLLSNQHGGGLWFSHDITGIDDNISVETLESAISQLFHLDLKISTAGVCAEKLTDTQLENIWDDLGDVLFDEADVPGDMVLTEYWRGFPEGTNRDAIWRYFDESHSKGVAFLLHGGHREFDKNIESCDDCYSKGDIDVYNCEFCKYTFPGTVG